MHLLATSNVAQVLDLKNMFFLKSSHSEFFHRQNLFTYPKMAAPAPPTQDSNLRGMAVLSISSVTFAVGANLVCLRMYVRMKRHITGWDDYTICIALVNTPLSISNN